MSLSLPSTASSSLRSLRSLPIALTSARSYASLSPYSPPSSSDFVPPRRPTRPSSSEFFTGRPVFHESLSQLNTTINSIKQQLRVKHIYPLPSELPYINPPQANWISKEEMSTLFDIKLRTNTLRQVHELLSELNHLRHVSELSGNGELVGKINEVLGRYERIYRSTSESTGNAKEEEEGQGVDEFGRSYGMGRKKTSSARVWLIPSPSLLSSTSSEKTEVVDSEILINHIPLSQYFVRPSDRETILRPLKITGYLGAFNIFGFSRGGGMSSQASAVGLAVARALGVAKEDARDVLQADGALMRDTRMTERKKTGRAKARKGYTWVKR
ncbi:hypothetical protein I302_107513 [Kwoniella bestiolae CBS 10118]|uniref:Uncharacterized protein n=1 Tax=Kwoniella bestiolae CBS 10118 TaxID=1296100 RepID=A0A1B9FYC8_9TREE|nr:hypothetical protein I302_06746 [Kwoniella bestiolae CBS 10118]OCF23762.1 hypothetical protein I302_06746 [Kwoniella bestiolae CBS 10118]